MKLKGKRKNNKINVGVAVYGNPGAITLISLVITIIILIILAGVAINLTIGENGIFNKAKYAKEKTNYASAKEIVMLNIAEAQTECTSEGRNCKIEDIAQLMKEKENVTIEKYYNSETALIKEGITENIVNLKGIVVSTNNYSKYKFLIGESCNIEGILLNNITDEVKIEDFDNIEEFETKNFDNIVVLPNGENKLYLYKAGNEYEEKTGGWTFVYNSGVNMSKNADNIYMYGASIYGNAQSGYIVTRTNNLIDVTNYSKMCVILKSKTNQPGTSTKIGITKLEEAYRDFNENCIEVDTNTDSNIKCEIDLTNIEGEYYPFIQVLNGHSGTYTEANIYEVWFEK